MLKRKTASTTKPSSFYRGAKILGIAARSIIFVFLIATVSILGSVALTVLQLGLEPNALTTAVLIPLVVSVPVASWMAGQQSRIRGLNQHLYEMVRRDALTGLLNSPAFVEEVGKKIHRGGLLVVCDVDRFKTVNDTFGHVAGDAVLISISDSLRACGQSNAIIGRLGGDEFGLFLQGITQEEAYEIAELLNNRVASTTVQHDGYPIACTLSLGLHFQPPSNPEGIVRTMDAIAAADAALYTAKSQGRNCYAVANDNYRVPKNIKKTMSSVTAGSDGSIPQEPINKQSTKQARIASTVFEETSVEQHHIGQISYRRARS